MWCRLVGVLGAAAAVLGMAGCSPDRPTAAGPSVSVSATSPSAAQRPAGGLPAADALTAVLSRLADPAVPGNQKLDLIEGATPADADRLDRFAKALADNGYTPPTFGAADLAWSDATPSNVLATVTADKPEPDGGFSLPMEFRPYRGGWQLSRGTLDLLLNTDAAAQTGTTASAPPR